MKKTIILLVLCCLAIPLVFGTNQAINGDIVTNWVNYPDRPQHFSGVVSGDLVGTIDLVSNTYYDSVSSRVGVTDAIVTATLNSMDCTGTYAGSNVDYGRNSGTFILNCDGDQLVIGNMFGYNTVGGDILAEYNGFIVPPNQGEKGDKGDTGEQGIQGDKGDKGDKGDAGLNGIDGINGLNGLDGAKGEKGDKGDKGDQGVQGLKGDKGDTGSAGDPTTLLSIFFAYPEFSDFSAWYNSPKECTNGQLQCDGNTVEKCVGYTWAFDKTCSAGCTGGVCNIPVPTTENCQTKPLSYCCNTGGYLIKTSYPSCKTGQGTLTACNIGQCNVQSKQWSWYGSQIKCVGQTGYAKC